MDNPLRYAKAVDHVILDEFNYIRHFDFSHLDVFNPFGEVIDYRQYAGVFLARLE